MTDDTIFALSSGSPPAAISVIRVSGALAHLSGETLAGSLPEARHAAVRELRDRDGVLLDEALVLRFDSPASSTAEDLVEFHCHGGRAVVNAVLAALSRIDGLRPAQPGEFTRRAFENGRIDLIEAEGLADLIEAETESQRRAALMMAEGGLSKRIAAWQDRLLELSARAEGAIDYVDEDSIDTEPQLSRDCGALAKEVDRWLVQPRAELLREGVRVVIAGPPNAGKSSLLNALVGHDRAIVTEVPGTTRDHIEVSLAFSGVPIRLTDTAGLRESTELVERIGVDRARGLIDLADILVWLGEAGAAPDHPRLIQVQPRSDLPGRSQAPEEAISVSSKTGEGLAELGAAIVAEARSLLPAEGQLALNARQADCVRDARDMLRAAESALDLVILAE
ncbi:MAG TPA: tRNA uridine-5-carboxymethylaminomethyl(34) synthesis GTPase MnmE, partial [Sphingomicrobium sp.]|nr:tRNA uridine-5-carboxymethylaminomethyl(34) synthesis GTPase MnmE [Sphingomicrobium sp.]